MDTQGTISCFSLFINDVIDANVARPSFALPEVTTGMGQSFSTWFYVKDWNYKFVDPLKRNDLAKWDDEGNLIS